MRDLFGEFWPCWFIDKEPKPEDPNLRKEADKRANNLLSTLLTPEQLNTYEALGYFFVQGPRTGNYYRLSKMWGEERITCYPADPVAVDFDQTTHFLCAVPDLYYRYPEPDILAAILLAILTDEMAFLETANIYV